MFRLAGQAQEEAAGPGRHRSLPAGHLDPDRRGLVPPLDTDIVHPVAFEQVGDLFDCILGGQARSPSWLMASSTPFSPMR